MMAKAPSISARQQMSAGSACLLLAVVVFPETALNAGRQAMLTWAQSVAPALFPFMVLMPLLTCDSAVRMYQKLFGRIMQPLFGLPGAFAPAVVIAMTAGSPAGASAAVRIAAKCGMGRKQLTRVMACICGAGPSFLIGGVGASMMGDAAVGRMLFRSQMITQLILLLLLSRGEAGDPVPETAETNAAGMGAAVNGLLAVCGYMMIFNTIAAMIARIFGNEAVSLAALCLLDLPSGAKAVSEMRLFCEIKPILLAAMIGFGGLCINVQNISACREAISPGIYLAIRAASALICAGVAAFFDGTARGEMLNFPDSMAISALVACIFAIPAWISLRNTSFLNKRKSDEIRRKNRKNPEKPQDVVVVMTKNTNIV